MGGPAFAQSKPIVGLITKTNTNPFFVKMREGAEAEAKKAGVELRTFAGKFDGDNQAQVEAIESLIAAGAKGILITASDTTAIVPTLKKARDKGILVIALDTPLRPDRRRRRDLRDRQLQGRRTDRPVGQGHPRRQGEGRQDRAPRPQQEPGDASTCCATRAS